MIFYLLLLAAAVLPGIPLCRLRHGKTAYCIAAGLLLFAAAAVRKHVGYDYNSYGTFYIECMPLSADQLSTLRMEKGFVMICKLLADYFTDYRTLFVFWALAFAAMLTYYIFRESEYPYLAVFGFMTFGLYFNTLNFIRQMAAAFIVLYGMRFLRRNNFPAFAVTAVFASCFHISALMMIPFYFILRIKPSAVSAGIFSLISAVSFIFSQDILRLVTSYVYKEYDPMTSVHMKTGLDPVYTVYFGLIAAAAFIFRREPDLMDEDSGILINCSFFAFFFELIGIKHSVVSRLSLYFLLPSALDLLPKIICCAYRKYGKISDKKTQDGRRIPAYAAAVTAAVICTSMYGYMTVRNYNGVMPYRTIFSDGTKG